MKRILVPTDFSEHAEDALKVAAQIAKKNNCEIFLLHMLELPSQMSDAISGGSGIPEVMLFIKKANETFQKIKERPYLNGISVSETVQFERASDGILSFCKKNKIDLIIMGSHGSSGIEEMLIGSNTEKVVRLSDIPVLVIKKDIGKFEARNFVFASDFSKEIKKPFKKMIEFTKIFDANLFLVMICTPNSFKTTLVAEKVMNDFIADFDIQNYSFHIFNDVNIENGILNFSNTINADLIGLCTHGRTGLAHFFNGSISEDLVNHTVKPVITFKI
ncbi:universal stress protein [Flavobacterium gawalongense]|uniref:Universal stress protein n=1 Tax=Flavobacterium gawalongense TaxID=2594432 RepID=A0A553BWX6_9FLAO|nr:universal stress protein [Flavobacterium gawalongense]TRX04186.1 universal stress protein [Flavobacterium gawalongense]TRX09364.1 universal stress protein [Flavobacterium gawalongense]TRX12822.1 universal stress protein [Flavobacterium gawalongense]TRX13167.1 universal stress protein [Flavobacterium gawalongense]TRX30771.1 universal stress protein [Flavobacterium gawalongense]